MHESQSLLMEMQVCRSRGFMEYLAPILRDTFGKQGPAYEPENLYRLGTRVKRSLIRVDADEATYPAHVILRYRLERQILSGNLKLADLPGAWRDGLQELFGVAPPDDRQGCLQDIHWYSGSWGYFPTYTLGAMTAAQLFAAAKDQNAAIEPGIAKGDFAPLVAWLHANVHSRASSVSSEEILTGATGRELEVGPFRRHLERRYCGKQ
jgi:carboxypeptidase Taq